MATFEGNPANLQTNLNIDDFQLQLSNLIKDGYTNSQLLSWLHENGVYTSDRTLKRRLQTWGVPRRHTEVDLNSGDLADELAERVNYLFHHTLLSDSQIAIKIAEEDGLQSSAN